MYALLITTSDDVRQPVQQACDEVSVPLTVCAALHDAERHYQEAPPALLILTCGRGKGDGQRENVPGFVDRTRTVVAAVAADGEALSEARALRPDVLISRLEADAVAAQLDVALRHAHSRRAHSRPAHEAAPAPVETKALHRILLQSLPRINDGLIVSDAQRPDDPVVYCNRAAELITGYAEHETLGRNMRFLQGPDTSEDARTAIREALQHEQSCTTVIKNYKKDGTPFWNEMSVVPIFDAGGTCTHVLGIIHDITAHRQDRRELQQSKRRLRRIIDAVPQCIFLKDEAGTYVLANKATARYLGTTRERLEGATDQEFASSGDGRDFRADDRSVIQTGEPKAFTETIVHADNEERIVQIEMLPFESALQDERQLLVIVTDITPRVRSEERWRRLVRYHPEPILISVDAKIQYVNAAGARAFGVSSADALIGESVLSFIAPAAHDEIRARSEAVKRGERTEPFEHRLIRPSGEERIVEAFSVPITYHGQAAAQTVVRDITEIRRASCRERV